MKKKKENEEMRSESPTPVKKIFLIRGEDVEDFESFEDDKNQIAKIRLKRGGRVVQIDDNPEGRGLLSSNIRRIVGQKATTRLISGATKPDKQNSNEHQ